MITVAQDDQESQDYLRVCLFLPHYKTACIGGCKTLFLHSLDYWKAMDVAGGHQFALQTFI